MSPEAPYVIRRAERRELPFLPELERRAGRRFEGIADLAGMPDDNGLPKGAQLVSGVEDVRTAVREQIGRGADWIKVYADYRRAPGKAPACGLSSCGSSRQDDLEP